MLSGVTESSTPGGGDVLGQARTGERFGVGAPLDPRLRRAQVGLERRAPGLESERRAERPRDPAQRLGVDPDGGGEHGHVAGERLEHRQAEALVPGGHQHRVDGVEPPRRERGVDAAEREQLDIDRARQLLGLDPEAPYLLFAADPSRAIKRYDLAIELARAGSTPPRTSSSTSTARASSIARS
jgi:hypothetical protein